MSSVKKINGYDIKDEVARDLVGLETENREFAIGEIESSIEDLKSSIASDKSELQTTISEINTSISNLETTTTNNYQQLSNTVSTNKSETDGVLETHTNNLNNLNIQVSVLNDKFNNHYSTFARRYYIDGVNGNDNNDGSINYPWKTMDKFLSLINDGKEDIRCYIVSPGDYYMSYPTLKNITLHITAKVDGVNIISTNDQVDFVMYGGHINMTSEVGYITLRSNFGRLYFENNAVTLKNVYIPHEVRFYGCMVDTDVCKFNKVICHSSNGYMHQTTITNTDPSNYGMLIKASQMALTGVFNVYELSSNNSNTGCIIVETGSLVHILHSITKGTNNYNRGLIATDSTIVITNARLNAFNNYGNLENSITNTVVLNPTN